MNQWNKCNLTVFSVIEISLSLKLGVMCTESGGRQLLTNKLCVSFSVNKLFGSVIKQKGCNQKKT